MRVAPSHTAISGQYEAAARTSERTSLGNLRVSTSGRYALPYTRIRTILLRYLSPIMVDSVLGRALNARNLLPTDLDWNSTAEVTSDIMVGLRLFVPASQLPRLMLELAEVLESDLI